MGFDVEGGVGKGCSLQSDKDEDKVNDVAERDGRGR